MNHGGKRILCIMALLWAVICGGFAYDVAQREKIDLYCAYNSKADNVCCKDVSSLSSGIQTQEQKKSHQAYRRELRELYWIFTPFLWISLTLSGYIIAAGLLLPVRWNYR